MMNNKFSVSMDDFRFSSELDLSAPLPPRYRFRDLFSDFAFRDDGQR